MRQAAGPKSGIVRLGLRSPSRLARSPRSRQMHVAETDTQRSARAAMQRLCARFGDACWLDCDRAHRFPHEFHRAMAEAGWLGICMPEPERLLRESVIARIAPVSPQLILCHIAERVPGLPRSH
jgi:alkylation response protein AidB-like acyl-CoA dehydrogenase